MTNRYWRLIHNELLKNHGYFALFLLVVFSIGIAILRRYVK